jgi:CRP/FNR family transcriptional regulator
MSRKRYPDPDAPQLAVPVKGASVVHVSRARMLGQDAHEECHPQAQTCMRCGVRHLGLFGALPNEALGSIQVHIDALRLKNGAVVMGEGQTGEFVYSVRGGLVRLERSTAQGARRILRIYGRGDAMGLESLLQRSYTASAIALGEVELCRIPASLIRDLSARYPALTQGLMQRWQSALDEADEWLSELSVGSARYRAMRLLQKLMRYFDDGIVVLPARSDIGAMLNVTLETASRLISDFKRDGLLEGQGPRWFRIDAERLAAAIEREVASD